MPEKNIVQQVEELVAKHQQYAVESPYDFKVSIRAIGAARSVIEDIDKNLSDEEYLALAVTKLTDLRERYYDSEGEYTSGKGEIGSLLNDISYLAEKD